MTQPLSLSPELEFCKVQEYAIGSNVDAFFAFFELDNRLHSIHRRFNLDLPDLSHTPEHYKSNIILSTYDESLCIVAQHQLCQGEDPRVVSNGRRAFILTHCFDAVKGGNSGYSLYILPEGTLVDLQVPSGLVMGKNWQPLLIEGQLYAVHSFAPFTLLAISEGGKVEIVRQSQTEYDLPAPHDGFTMFRGGCNGLAIRDGFVGLGHLTSRRDEHRPFLWSWRDGRHLGITLSSGFFGLREKGFNIVDPTSLFRFRESLYLGLCASEREWFYAQRFAQLLVKMPIDALDRADHFSEITSADVVSTLALSHTFIPARLPNAVPRRITDSGIESIGKPGHIIYGPYLPIDRFGETLVKLTYSSDQDLDEARQIGVFDVLLHIGTGFECLGAVTLLGTHGDVRTLHIELQPRTCPGSRLETRVWAGEGCHVRVYGLRMIERPSLEPPGSKA